MGYGWEAEPFSWNLGYIQKYTQKYFSDVYSEVFPWLVVFIRNIPEQILCE